MNRAEKRILREAIRAVAQANSNAWWELKRQIYDGGFQSYYPVQGDFDHPAQRVIAAQSNEVKSSLLKEWRSARPARPQLSDSEILEAYGRLVVEEVVARARLAAYRTTNW